ncbi:serine protease inhibitor ecotin [Sulfurovum riftiae]|uniref:Ecotin n=1 Tax=Sulfurovum riftiae TaxID=1630136 RepID=A0A151CGA7_9BACT|nr:serine protease inhibitor ecotin [Sulfurovum riftiae]KYJ86537.1 hypothetical protein AS592_06965 [Sulfurovum riftiae]
MIKRMLFGLALALSTISLHAADVSKEKYGMFPQPEEGYVRYIVDVPKTENDYDHKVELLIGKTMLVDCNHHSFSGKVERIPLEGWGYTYYKVSDIKSGPTTMMACRGPKKEAFISVHLPREMQLMRYNSRLGTVVYVPEGFEVRYRIWHAEKEIQKAVKR